MTKFKEVLDTIENEDFKAFAEELITTIPDYFWVVPASSTGKYHPQYALGEGGLYRHTLALCRILNHILSLEYIQQKFPSKVRDCLRIAGMMHDSRKSGSQEEYEHNKFTKFDHPVLAAEVVRSYKGKDFIPDEGVEYIAQVIETHMGQWNTDRRSSVVLKKPDTFSEFILHVSDYLASRKDIEVLVQ